LQGQWEGIFHKRGVKGKIFTNEPEENGRLQHALIAIQAALRCREGSDQRDHNPAEQQKDIGRPSPGL
jgi:hypothetical protein